MTVRAGLLDGVWNVSTVGVPLSARNAASVESFISGSLIAGKAKV
jgi:hypothetical protein